MNEKKLRNKNLAFRILIFIATYAGVNAVMGFFNLKAAIGSLSDYGLLAMVSGISFDYLVFMALSIAVFVMSFVSKRAANNTEFIIRTIILGISVILIWYSLPAISYIAYTGASRYSDIMSTYQFDIDFVASYISSNLWTVFTYMIAAGLYVVCTITSIISIIRSNRRKKLSDSNMNNYNDGNSGF